MAANNVRWSDSATTNLLELLRTRESLWNVKEASYRDRNKKKTEYGAILVEMQDDVPGIDLASLKGKIQSLRTTYREEVRKIRKSEGTGKGLMDIYVPKWRHFLECSFLEDVIASNQPGLSNAVPSTVQSNPRSHFDEGCSNSTGNPFDLGQGDDEHLSDKETEQQPPKRKRGNSQWMETAASDLNELAKGAKSFPTKDYEWDVFGRDVANSIRAINQDDLQRSLKFAIQSSIFQIIEQGQSSIQQVPQPSSHASNPYICLNTYQENNGATYHTL